MGIVGLIDVAEKISMLQGSSVYAKEIKDDVLQLKEHVDDSNIQEIIAMIIEILDFIIENSVQLEEQMTQTLKSGIEYCASPNESIDGDLIVQQLEIMKHKIHMIALLDTLEYLQKGGRIPKSVAFIGGVLSIKPVVTIKDGEVHLLGTARGSRSGNNYLRKAVESIGGIDFSRPFLLGYSGNDASLLNSYIENSTSLYSSYTKELPICNVGATIGTHVGPNGIVVAFFEKD